MLRFCTNCKSIKIIDFCTVVNGTAKHKYILTIKIPKSIKKMITIREYYLNHLTHVTQLDMTIDKCAHD